MINIVPMAHQNPLDFDETRHMSDQLKDSLKSAQEILRRDIKKILRKLDFEEWVSLIFLLFDETYQCSEGFKNIQDISSGKIERVSSSICSTLASCQNYETAFDPLIEAFYHLGRYDILENDLNLCWEHTLDKVGKSLNCLFPENLALHQVFTGLTQEQVDGLVSQRLKHWYSYDVSEMFEIIFLRNLDHKRKPYLELVKDLHKALEEEGLLSLASLLQPFIWKKTSISLEPHSPTREVDETEFYAMPQGEPHGLCVIINVDHFREAQNKEEDFPLETRRGSDIDKDMVEGTFKLFGFSVVHLNNPDYEEFCNFFTKLRKDVRLYAMASLVVCVMTHGDKEDNLYLADRKCIAVTDLRRLCYARALICKPKMFFIQACRGEEILSPMLLQRDATITSNTESDCLISQATVGRHSAMRSQSSGSWYITDLCSTLQEIGHQKPLKTVMNTTRAKLMERVDKFRGMYITQISEDRHTLTKEVQLKRGTIDSFLEGILDLTVLKIFPELIECLISEAVIDAMLGEVGEQN